MRLNISTDKRVGDDRKQGGDEGEKLLRLQTTVAANESNRLAMNYHMTPPLPFFLSHCVNTIHAGGNKLSQCIAAARRADNIPTMPPDSPARR